MVAPFLLPHNRTKVSALFARILLTRTEWRDTISALEVRAVSKTTFRAMRGSEFRKWRKDELKIPSRDLAKAARVPHPVLAHAERSDTVIPAAWVECALAIATERLAAARTKAVA